MNTETSTPADSNRTSAIWGPSGVVHSGWNESVNGKPVHSLTGWVASCGAGKRAGFTGTKYRTTDKAITCPKCM
jgi:hypothetical protein